MAILLFCFSLQGIIPSLCEQEPDKSEESHRICKGIVLTPMAGFLQALEIMENLENQHKKFHAWKNHGIWKTQNNHGKIMEICEINWQNHQ